MSNESSAQEKLVMLNRQLQRSTDHAVIFNAAVAERCGVHPTDLKVLSLLDQRGALSAGRIAQLTGLTTGAVTFALDRLEKAGYAHRVRHPNDRRVVLIEMNRERVEKDMHKYYGQMEEAVREVVAAYTDAELAFALDFMTRMNEAAERVIERVHAMPADE